MILSGCTTNSATDNSSVRVTPGVSMPTIASPVPLNLTNASTLPVPARNTSTATPVPLPVNKSVNTSSAFASGLPPAVIFTHVPAYGSSEMLQGSVTGIDNAANYKLAIYINNLGWWNVPSADQRLTDIRTDGTWECNITRDGTGRKATEITAFLVPAGFLPQRVMGRSGLPTDVRDNCTAVNSVKRIAPKATPMPSPTPKPDYTGPNFIY